MAKNFPALYANSGYSTALDQKIFIKAESARGTAVLPLAADFLWHVAGSVNFTQPIEDSPHKSGRHQTNVIKQKTATAWTLTTLFNIDTSLVAKSLAEIDPAMRVLYKSVFGKETTSGGSPVFDTSEAPSTSFTMFEVCDTFSKQSWGAFVESCNMTFPGDGRAQAEWAGSAKYSILVGMGKSTIDNTANTVTVQAGEGRRFPVGAKVMIIKANNAKSTDTPAGTARTVTDVTGEVVTLDGAILADADGSSSPIYLVPYEPETPVAIDDPQVGLVGSFSIDGETFLDCVRSVGINCVNNHELANNCFGEEGLGGPLWSNAGKFGAEVTVEANMSKDMVGFLNDQKSFTGEDLTLILGDAAGRHLKIELPKVIFQVSEVSVGDTGTVPVTLTGSAKQTDLDAADEITVSFL